MIKKLNVIKDTRNVIDKDGIVHTAANFTAIEKINELVDAFNKLQDDTKKLKVGRDTCFGRIDTLNRVIHDLRNQNDKLNCAILDLATPDGENKALKNVKQFEKLEIKIDFHKMNKDIVISKLWTTYLGKQISPVQVADMLELIKVADKITKE